MCPKLVVVTVNYACADAILEGMAQTVAQLEQINDARFWIVDNDSPDDSLRVLKDAVADQGWEHIVEVIAAERNGGFGAGNNVAIRRGLSQGEPPDYFYFLNPDATPQPDAIQKLVSFMDDNPHVGVAGGLLCDETGDIQTSSFRFPSFWSELEDAIGLGVVTRLLRRHVTSLPKPSGPQKVGWVAGTSFIARRQALEVAGSFDENFFLYWEEIELCHRIDAAGFGIWAIPDAIVLHTGGVSTGMHKPEKRIPAYWFEARDYFFKITGRGGNTTVLNIATACGLVVRRAHQMMRGRTMTPPHYLRDFLKYSLFAGNSGVPTPMQKDKTKI